MKLIHACSKRDKSQKHCDSERNQGKKKCILEKAKLINRDCLQQRLGGTDAKRHKGIFGGDCKVQYLIWSISCMGVCIC